jgi:NAD(P)-dependent dehydrogenase (short-subunit alcohol dehydrogenase family)
MTKRDSIPSTAPVVLITGCRSGFGLLAAVEAANAGYRVYAGLRDLSSAAELRRAAGDLPITPVQLDVTSEQERVEVVRSILEAEGRLDGLVNNAGIAIGGFWEQFEADELRKMFEVNVFGVWALTKLCLPTMRSRGAGVIINISSMAGRMGTPGLGMYAGSKFALEGMSEALRHELRPFGVRVVLVEPGPYKTDIFERNRRMCRGSEAPGPYAALQAKVLGLFEKIGPKMGDAREVSRLIVRLLDEPAPRLRYPLGPSVRPRLWMRTLLPFWLEERVIDRVLDRGAR